MGDSELRVYVPPYDGFDNKGYPVAWQEIKHQVREDAGHRCVRCSHPFVCGETPGEWSPCDGRCAHGGPLRARLHVNGTVCWEDEYESPGPPSRYIEPGNVHVEARWRVLTVHHLTGDKADCRWWNLAALCQRCHLTIQGKVVMDRAWPHEHSAWFRPYAAGWYAFYLLGEDLNREEVECRLDELLALESRQLDLSGGSL